MNVATFQLPWTDALAGAALLIRCLAFVALVPVVGGEAVPARVRVGFALLLTFLIAPLAPPLPPETSLVSIALSETLVGVLLGFTGRLLLEAASVAGMLAGFPTTLSVAQILDPNTAQPTITLGVFYRLVATGVFIAIGGPQQLIAGLVTSYAIVPCGTAHLTHVTLPALLHLTGGVLVLGLRMAAPVLVTGLLVDVALMLISRAVPQMNIFAVGAPLRVGVGLFAIGASLQVFAPLLGGALDTMVHDTALLLRGLAAGT